MMTIITNLISQPQLMIYATCASWNIASIDHSQSMVIGKFVDVMTPHDLLYSLQLYCIQLLYLYNDTWQFEFG